MSKTTFEYFQSEAAEPDPRPLVDQSHAHEFASQLALISDLHPEGPTAELDLACQRLCAAYAQAPVRDHVRTAINPEQSWALVRFSRRCSKLTWRSANPDALRCSLVAHSIAGFRHGDPRDSIIALGDIRDAAMALNLDVLREFQNAAMLAGPTIAEFLTELGKT